MDKEEILAKSRDENKNGDEMEKKNQITAQAISASVGMLLCMIFVFVEEVIFDRSATALWIIYCGIQFTSSILDYMKTKKKFSLLMWLLYGAALLVNTAVYIMECIGI